MKRILLSSVALFGLTLGATAADLPRRAVAPAPFVPVPVFTWTGFYVGVNAGGAFRNDDRDSFNELGFAGFGGNGLAVPTFPTGALAPVVPLSGFNSFGFGGFHDGRDSGGFTGGGQVGYNFQFTPGSGFVVGVEADIQAVDFGGRRRDDVFGFGGFGGGTGIFTATPVLPAVAGFGIATPTGIGTGALGNVALFNNGVGLGNGFGNGRNHIDWFATVRGRLGYAFDRLLIYATGGVAFTDSDDRDRFDAFGFGFGGGVPNGASLVGTGFYVGGPAGAAAFAGSLVNPTNTVFFGDRDNRNDIGWTVGGGVEYAFTHNITAKIEGLYVNFDRDRRHNGLGFGNDVVGVSNTGAPIVANQLGFGLGFGDGHRRHNDFGVVRAGLNFKFGS